ncbi:MAG: DNA repair protein RecO [Elusimicrobia bacterium]|nr:DNA repair protein RecO [Elusimicrobiota bacterium]
MIVNACAMVLGRRPYREADRLATLYTDSWGKLTVRFVGVDKPGRKLKALSEPLVWGEYRLYLSPRLDMGKVIGGRIISTFPSIRRDLRRTALALSFCEWLSGLAPERSPNEEKYELLSSVVASMEEAEASPWHELAYGLRLMRLLGYGMSRCPDGPERAPLWRALHEAPWRELETCPDHPGLRAKWTSRLHEAVRAQLGRPLNCQDFLEALPCRRH